MIGLCMMLLCAAILCACAAKAPTWQEQYDLGVRYLSEENYEEAIVAFSAAIEIDPKRAEAYVGVAKAYRGADDEASALAWLQKGMEQASDTSEIAALLAELGEQGSDEPTQNGGGQTNENANAESNSAVELPMLIYQVYSWERYESTTTINGKEQPVFAGVAAASGEDGRVLTCAGVVTTDGTPQTLYTLSYDDEQRTIRLEFATNESSNRVLYYDGAFTDGYRNVYDNGETEEVPPARETAPGTFEREYGAKKEIYVMDTRGRVKEEFISSNNPDGSEWHTHTVLYYADE